jgi:hypothetical protein
MTRRPAPGGQGGAAVRLGRGPPAPGYRIPRQKRWMRVQASFSEASSVA